MWKKEEEKIRAMVGGNQVDGTTHTEKSPITKSEGEAAVHTRTYRVESE